MESGRACVTADTVHRLRGGGGGKGVVSAREKIISNYIAARRFHLRQRMEDDRSLVVFILRGPRAASEPPGVD